MLFGGNGNASLFIDRHKILKLIEIRAEIYGKRIVSMDNAVSTTIGALMELNQCPSGFLASRSLPE